MPITSAKRAIWFLATLGDCKHGKLNVDCVGVDAKEGEWIVVWKAGDTDAPPQTTLDSGLPNHLLQPSHFPLDRTDAREGRPHTLTSAPLKRTTQARRMRLGRELLHVRQKAWLYLLLPKERVQIPSPVFSPRVSVSPPLFTEGDEHLSLPASLFIWKQRECVNVCAETFVSSNSSC